MGVEHRRIYDDHAATYGRLVSADEHEGSLLRALEPLVPAPGARVLEVGVGTGRVARQLLAAGCPHLVGVAPAPAMVAELSDRRMVVPECTGLWSTTNVAGHGGAR